ncbi:hypothetical protein ACIG3E_05795 [Streptomyces sp. NPDC053474]|uniref:hypothetical protein n=1 Tax=Streptomyces sp. NPDC053474 TaxID=3365704 RepID=UPI0037D113C4
MTRHRASRRAVAGAGAALLSAVWCAAALPATALPATALPATALPATAHAAETPRPQPYAFADDVRTVAGTPSSTGSRALMPGSTYRSSIKPPGPGGTTQLYYRLDLGAKDNVYVSATALPGLGSQVGFADGIRVSVEDANGFDCDSGSVRFGASRSPRPLTASASRVLGPDQRQCATAGTYYVVVERTVDSRSSISSPTAKPSTTETWDLELHVSSEPALAERGATTPPRTGDPGTPVPPAGPARPRAGGSSFSTAKALDRGVWGDGVEPGRTRYYRVPVDWGQRLSATVEVGGARGTGVSGGIGGSGGSDGSGRSRGSGAGGGAASREYVTSALVVSVFNPARGPVDDMDTAYDGRQKSATLPTLPPVAYENRYAPISRVAGVRFAGWYYLAVSLDPDVGARFGDGAVGLTLRVGVFGERRPGPAYAGAARPADAFGVTERDEAAARGGASGGPGGRGAAAAAGTGGDAAMKVLAAAGIGTGTVLVAVLGVWTLVGRRRATGRRASA